MLLISDNRMVESSILPSLTLAKRKADFINSCEFSSSNGFARAYGVALFDLEFPVALGNEFLQLSRRPNPDLSTILLARDARRSRGLHAA